MNFMVNQMNKLQKNRKNKNKGFTLVELIIVIAIIAVLAAVLAPQYIQYVEKSRWATDQNNAATLLHEIQVGIVEVSSEGKSVAAEDITFTSGGVSALTKNADLNTALGNTDPNWNKISVKNNGKATGSHTTFTISITTTGATGAWS